MILAVAFVCRSILSTSDIGCRNPADLNNWAVDGKLGVPSAAKFVILSFCRRWKEALLSRVDRFTGFSIVRSISRNISTAGTMCRMVARGLGSRPKRIETELKLLYKLWA